MDSGDYWKTIVETVQEGLMVVDRRGNILSVNPAAEEITGYCAEELVGRSCRILNCTGCNIIGPGESGQWCSLFARGAVRGKHCTITRKDQRKVHVSKTASVLRDRGGEVIGAVETLTDITESVRQQDEIDRLRKSLAMEKGYRGMIGRTGVMQRLFTLIDSVSRSQAPVLILGPSGTGKELVARAIHESSPRKEMPFIKVNCAALNENLLESELFGHVRGAYTGAAKDRIGRFEAAHGGSIFLDEIGDVPPATQVKLLRVLEEREIERVGDHRPVPVDVRVITATNRNLEVLIEKGLFREDLLFRINVFPIHCPPLSERREDIPVIARELLETAVREEGASVTGFTPGALAALMRYGWPGNVRELRNTIHYALVLCPSGLVEEDHLPPKITGGKENAPHRASLPVDGTGVPEEKAELLEVLRAAGGNRSEAARRIGVSRVTVWKRMKKHGIQVTSDFT